MSSLRAKNYICARSGYQLLFAIEGHRRRMRFYFITSWARCDAADVISLVNFLIIAF
jgi:hypothetical protein